MALQMRMLVVLVLFRDELLIAVLTSWPLSKRLFVRLSSFLVKSSDAMKGFGFDR